MKIAMILRPDADSVFGGDTVVMQKMSAAMVRLGSEVVIGQMEEMPPAREFDLLHIFTAAPVPHVERMVAWARAGGNAIVVSPLYYNDFRDWFERAMHSAPRWRLLVRWLGKARAWQVYRTWQTARLPFQHSWRTIRSVLLGADTVATSSRWENAWIAEHFRLPPSVRARMRLSPLGIDADLYGQTFSAVELAEFRARYGLEEGYLAQVARIEEKKNQLAVIEALYDDPVPLVFVGKVSPYFAPDYADRCYELGRRRGRVHFLGWLPEAELPLLYAGAAAHIMASWVELPGLSSLEAGASGTRIVSTRISPLPELLGDQAWYCDPYDRASIRAGVQAALSSPAPTGLRQRLLAEFNWARVAVDNLALYEDVLRSRQ
ncbi:MAG: hypothetical protein CVU38_00330 [Chloroflexi bacterium HGW-Chloroflexi-1]|nr:MAG: hypothetical protein CVU38_00330 [Chloroflexi bacterium HGW-Chloroflexi-1]